MTKIRDSSPLEQKTLDKKLTFIVLSNSMNIYILKQLARAGFIHGDLRRMSKSDRLFAITIAELNDLTFYQ